MKPGIHPEFVETRVTCGCGYTFTTMSSEAELHVDICSNCHPFFTGTQKLVDTQGQVDRFKKRLDRHGEMKSTSEEAPPKKRERGPVDEQKAVAIELDGAAQSVDE